MKLTDAIRYADMMAADKTPPPEYYEEQRTYAMMCADALRFMRKMLRQEHGITITSE